MMVRGKRGVSGQVFTWILASVAGAVVFLFFARFAFQHIGIQGTLNERELIEHLQDELEAFGVAEQSHRNIILTEEEKLHFPCGRIGVGTFLVDVPQLIFAPLTLEGKEFLAWTQEWRFPFPVTNFFYLTQRGVKIILVYDSGSSGVVGGLGIPAGFSVQKIQMKDFDVETLAEQVTAGDKVHLVFFTDVKNVQQITDALGAEVRVMEVDAGKHRIHFFDIGQDAFYLGDEMLAGALFAPEQYPCLMNLAVERLWIVGRVLDQRARLLRGKTDDARCSELLFGVSSILKQMIGEKDVEELYTLHGKLEEQQTELERHHCVSAY